jgi:hypothetical protein
MTIGRFTTAQSNLSIIKRNACFIRDRGLSIILDVYAHFSYNLGALGDRLAVGHRTLDPAGEVRILLPQPLKIYVGLFLKGRVERLSGY